MDIHCDECREECPATEIKNKYLPEGWVVERNAGVFPPLGPSIYCPPCARELFGNFTAKKEDRRLP